MESDLRLQFASQYSGKTNQPGSQESQGALLRNNNIGVAARNLGRSVEETLPGIDGQLHSRSIHGASGVPSAAQRTGERVVMGSVSQCNQCPSHRPAERSGKNRAIRNPAGAVADNREGSASAECTAHLKTPRRQGSGCEADRT